MTQQISFTAETLWDKTEYQFTAVTDGDFNTTFTVISPEKIRNFKLAFSGDIVTLYYLDLEHELYLTDLPENFPAKVIYEGLKSAGTENTTVFSADNKYFIKYEVDGTEYMLFLGETGLPLEITDKSGNISIIFKNTTILH